MLQTSTLNNGSAGVGLSNADCSTGRRRLLDLVNRMRNTGVQQDIDIPMIAVIGSQSAGKSSLIESISGITLPRASGTCTRCPTECRLSHSDEPWKCTVSLHFIADERGEPVKQVRNVTFGEPIFDKAEVEERIKRAQHAILSPHINYLHILQGDIDTWEDAELSFSINFVSLQISGQGVADLSFVDLPGLIASVGNGGSAGDIDLVKNLVTSYISRPSCIILLTVACETDFENQGAHHLAKMYDPEGKRIIGVLTKPDRIPAGEEDRWLRFIKGEYERLDNGWYTVKQPDSQALAAGITWDEAREKENEYFGEMQPWAGLDFAIQQHLGTTNLTERCSDVLSGLIARRLPELQNELDNLLQATEDSISKLPRAPSSSDPVGQVLNLIGAFNRDMAKYVEGTPNPRGLLQAIRPAQLQFRRAIRSTAPDFRPFERTAVSDGFKAPNFLANEEEPFSPEDDARAIYIDDVMKRAKEAITRELPDVYPSIVTEQYILDVVKQWHDPAAALYKKVQEILLKQMKDFVQAHFEQYPHLQQQINSVVAEYIRECSTTSMSVIKWLLKSEQRPRTLNDHYYRDYRDKFFAHYKASRPKYNNASLAQTQPGTTTATYVNTIISNYSALGVHGISQADLAKVLPSDPHEAALEIMARARAYFQVAYKRFADNVPNAIDDELILGLDKSGGLESLLRQRLGIHGADGANKCAEYLQEPSSVSQRRAELKKKLDRLETAKKELMELWL